MSPADKQFLFVSVSLEDAPNVIDQQQQAGRKLSEAMSGPVAERFAWYVLVFYPKTDDSSTEGSIPGYDSPPVDDSGVGSTPTTAPRWNRPTI